MAKKERKQYPPNATEDQKKQIDAENVEIDRHNAAEKKTPIGMIVGALGLGALGFSLFSPVIGIVMLLVGLFTGAAYDNGTFDNLLGGGPGNNNNNNTAGNGNNPNTPGNAPGAQPAGPAAGPNPAAPPPAGPGGANAANPTNPVTPADPATTLTPEQLATLTKALQEAEEQRRLAQKRGKGNKPVVGGDENATNDGWTYGVAGAVGALTGPLRRRVIVPLKYAASAAGSLARSVPGMLNPQRSWGQGVGSAVKSGVGAVVAAVAPKNLEYAFNDPVKAANAASELAKAAKTAAEAYKTSVENAEEAAKKAAEEKTEARRLEAEKAAKAAEEARLKAKEAYAKAEEARQKIKPRAKKSGRLGWIDEAIEARNTGDRVEDKLDKIKNEIIEPAETKHNSLIDSATRAAEGVANDLRNNGLRATVIENVGVGLFSQRGRGIFVTGPDGRFTFANGVEAKNLPALLEYEGTLSEYIKKNNPGKFKPDVVKHAETALENLNNRINEAVKKALPDPAGGFDPEINEKRELARKTLRQAFGINEGGAPLGGSDAEKIARRANAVELTDPAHTERLGRAVNGYYDATPGAARTGAGLMDFARTVPVAAPAAPVGAPAATGPAAPAAGPAALDKTTQDTINEARAKVEASTLSDAEKEQNRKVIQEYEDHVKGTKPHPNPAELAAKMNNIAKLPNPGGSPSAAPPVAAPPVPPTPPVAGAMPPGPAAGSPLSPEGLRFLSDLRSELQRGIL